MSRMPDPTLDISPMKDPGAIGQAGFRSVFAALVALAVAVFLFGCGLEGQPFSTDNEGNDSSTLVSKERIAGKDPGSPGATVLKWWRGLQTRNPPVVEAAYTPKVREELPSTFESTVVAVLAPSAAESSIATESLEKQGRRKATLFSTIDSPNATMDGPLALPMQKVRNKWLIANSSFVTSVSGAFALEEALGGDSDTSTEQKPSKAKEPSGG